MTGHSPMRIGLPPTVTTQGGLSDGLPEVSRSGIDAGPRTNERRPILAVHRLWLTIQDGYQR